MPSVKSTADRWQFGREEPRWTRGDTRKLANSENRGDLPLSESPRSNGTPAHEAGALTAASHLLL